MANAVPTLGELEVQVLRLVWRQQPCTEREVSERVRAGRPVARTTVLKTLQRLEAKGLLARVPGAGPVRYRAAVEERRLLPALIRRFVAGFLGGSAEPLAAYLAGAAGLSDRDVRQLQAIARKLRRDERTGGGRD